MKIQRSSENQSIGAVVVRWTALLAALSMLCPGSSPAGLLAPGSDELLYSFSVSGYEIETRMVEPVSLALDPKADRVYVADRKAGELVALTLQGAPVTDAGPIKLSAPPVSVAVAKDGTLFVADSVGDVSVFKPGADRKSLELPKTEDDASPAAGRLTVDRDGNLYVVDRQFCRILVFDKELKLRLTVGGKGNRRGQFESLEDVAVDRQGRIYALDSSGTPVQVFDKKGRYLYRIGFRGGGEEDILAPAAVFVDQNDQVWVVDAGTHSLKVFDRSGDFVRRFGTYGSAAGSFFEPVDAEMDQFGRLYVLESGARRLQVFSVKRPFEAFAPRGL